MPAFQPIPGDDLVWTETRGPTRSVVAFEGPAPSTMLGTLGVLLTVAGVVVALAMTFTDSVPKQSARVAPLAPLVFLIAGAVMIVRVWRAPSAGRIEADAERVRVVPAGVRALLPFQVYVRDVECFRSSEDTGPQVEVSTGGSSSVASDRWHTVSAVLGRGERVSIAAFANPRTAASMAENLNELLDRARALGASDRPR